MIYANWAIEQVATPQLWSGVVEMAHDLPMHRFGLTHIKSNTKTIDFICLRIHKTQIDRSLSGSTSTESRHWCVQHNTQVKRLSYTFHSLSSVSTVAIFSRRIPEPVYTNPGNNSYLLLRWLAKRVRAFFLFIYFGEASNQSPYKTIKNKKRLKKKKQNWKCTLCVCLCVDGHARTSHREM